MLFNGVKNVPLLLYIALEIVFFKPDGLASFLSGNAKLTFTGCERLDYALYANYTTTYKFDNYTTVSCPVDNITLCQLKPPGILPPYATPCDKVPPYNILCQVLNRFKVINIINSSPVKNYVYFYGSNSTGIYRLMELSTQPLDLCRLKKCRYMEPLVPLTIADFDERENIVYFSHEQIITSVVVYNDRLIRFGLRDVDNLHFLHLLTFNTSGMKDQQFPQDHQVKINNSCDLQYDKLCVIVTWPYCDENGVRNQVNSDETCLALSNDVKIPKPLKISQFSCWRMNSKLQTSFALQNSREDRSFFSALFMVTTQDDVTIKLETNKTRDEFEFNSSVNLQDAVINVTVCNKCQLCTAGGLHVCKVNILGVTSSFSNGALAVTISVSVSVGLVLALIAGILWYHTRFKKKEKELQNDENDDNEPMELIDPPQRYVDVLDEELPPPVYDKPVKINPE